LGRKERDLETTVRQHGIARTGLNPAVRKIFPGVRRAA
jgi:hypothetical protein